MIRRTSKILHSGILIAAISMSGMPSASFAADSAEQEPLSKTQIIHQINQLVDDRNPNSPIFVQGLGHSEKSVILASLTGLGRIGGKAVIPLVTPLLSHENEKIRQHAAFALGLSANKESAHYLWQQLETETNDLVKHEIYLSLGNLGQNGLVSRMLERLEKEPSVVAQASLFQGLGIAMVFHRDLKDDYEDIDFEDLIALFAKGDPQAARVGFFIDRVPGVGKLIESEEILPLTRKKLSPLAAIYLTRLIAKISEHDSSNNRELLAWLIEQAEKRSLGERIEAMRGMRNMMDFPQSLVQLGKMQASKEPIIAQTALNVLATSDNNSRNIVSLLKRQLKNRNETLVVEAMRGLIKRQTKDEMSWVVTLLKHPSAYVKIQLMSLLKEKSKTDFNKTIEWFAQDPDPRVSRLARRLNANLKAPEATRASAPNYSEVSKVIGKLVTLKTTVGDITIKLLPDSPYTAWHFVNNAKKGVFNNNYFSRVIGNFVAQGGDTIGDRTGSSNQTIREEINFLKSEPMTVAMATSGKDTGTSQFYINTARNLHLDRNYTIFGRVVSGYDRVLWMTNGARILNVTIE